MTCRHYNAPHCMEHDYDHVLERRELVLDAPRTRTLASGNIAGVDLSGRVIAVADPVDLYGEPEPPTCPICDAYNCGGDGLGCKQFEGRDRWDPDDELERQLEAIEADARWGSTVVDNDCCPEGHHGCTNERCYMTEEQFREWDR